MSFQALSISIHQFRERVNKERFEDFCNYFLRNILFKRNSTAHYHSRYKDRRYPFDAEVDGGIGAYQGKILFEFKGPEAGTYDSKARSQIKEDLCGNRSSKGKLQRAGELRKEAVLYVLIMSIPSTDLFESDIRTCIKKKRLPFNFECWSFSRLSEWFQQYPELNRFLSLPEENRTLSLFIRELLNQQAPVNFPQYRHIDEIFIPPHEFDKILNTLQHNKIVFIIGPPHVGKTFTAVYLLWYFYKVSGLKPRWITPKPLEQEPFPVRRISSYGQKDSDTPLVRLIENNVGSDRVTYIEDIFGQRSDEEIREGKYGPQELLLHLIDFAEETPGAKVIVTSRDKLFNKAVKKSPKLDQLIVRLKGKINVKISSYKKKDKFNIMGKYASLYSCCWIDMIPKKLPPDVQEAAENLATPAAIEFYCRLSCAERTVGGREKCFKKSHQELTKAFASEIIQLNEISLAALLVAEHFTPSAQLFAAAFPRFLIDKQPDAVWKKAIQALKDRIQVSEKEDIKYFHPSFREAVKIALADESTSRLFNEMVKNLYKHRRCRGNLAFAATNNFKHLDNNGRGLLRSLCTDDDEKVRKNVAAGLGNQFKQLDNVARKLLQSLCADSKKEVRGCAAYALASQFKYLNTDERTILHSLRSDRYSKVLGNMASGLAHNFRDLDEDGYELLRSLCADPNDEVRKSAASALAFEFDRLYNRGRKLLYTLSEDPIFEVRLSTASGLIHLFDRLDKKGHKLLYSLCTDHNKNVRIKIADLFGYSLGHIKETFELLHPLVTDSCRQVRKSAAYSLAKNFQNLNKDGRYLLRSLCQVSERDIRKSIARGLSSFDQLTKPGRDLLRFLCGDPDKFIRATAIDALSEQFKYLNQEERLLLLSHLSDSSTLVQAYTAYSLAKKFRYLNQKERDFLCSISVTPNSNVRTWVASGLTSEFEYIDKAGRDLLRSLCKDPEAEVRKSMAYGLANKINCLDKEGKELLDALLADPEEKVRINAVEGLPSFADLEKAGQDILRALCTSPDKHSRASAALKLSYEIGSLDEEWEKISQFLCADPEKEVRASVVSGLAYKFENLNKYWGELLLGLFSDPEMEVREEATASLAYGFDRLNSEGRELLRSLCNDPAKEIRAAAARGLTFTIGHYDYEKIQFFRPLCFDPEKEVRATVAFRLAEHYVDLDKDLEEILQSLSVDPEFEVRGNVAAGLAFCISKLDESGCSLLHSFCVSSDKEVRKFAAFWLADQYEHLDENWSQQLRILCADPEKEVQKYAASGLALRNLGYEKGELFESALDDFINGIPGSEASFENYCDLFDKDERELLQSICLSLKRNS